MQSNNLQARFHAIRSNKVFELFVIGIIIFSALVIGAKTFAIPDSILQLVNVLDWAITGLSVFYG